MSLIKKYLPAGGWRMLLPLLLSFCFLNTGLGQFSLSQSLDRQYYCSGSSVMRETGKIQSFNATVYKGFKYHFYYYSSGVYSEIGNFTAMIVGANIFTFYGNLNPGLFDGSQIGNANKLIGTSSQLWISIDIPYAAFPNNNTGQQLVVDVEAIDQGGNTTTHSTKSFLSVPLLYTNPVTLSSPSINASAASVCSGGNVTLSSSPNFASYGFQYDWYKDGVLFQPGDLSGTLSVNSPGTYYAYVYDGCQHATSSSVVIGNSAAPAAPSVSAGGSTVLCDGASVTLNASGSVPANILWYFNGSSTGHFGGSYTVNSAGTYTAVEQSACGTSVVSNSIGVTTNTTPAAPVLNVTGNILLCDGASQSFMTAPSTSGGVIHWSTGYTGNTLSVSSAGNYYAWESNGSCGAGPNSAVVGINTLNTPAAPVVNPPVDQLLCNGASVTLTSTGGNITWSNGATGNTISTSVGGNYYTRDNNACGYSANSNVVAITTGSCPTPAPGTSFFICPGTMKTLDAGAGYESYLWNTGATSQTVSVGPGTYSVTVMKNGCTAVSATVTVAYYSVGASLITASGPLSFCDGGSVTLSASNGGSYLWSNGATTKSITVGTTGSYYVTVTDANGCQATSAVVGTNVNPLPTASISGTTTICQNSASPVIVFTGNGAAAPYTFTYTINGGVPQVISTSSGNSVTVPVPTSTAGVFTYSLVSVQESSGTSCSNLASGSAVVTINPLPVASVSGAAIVCQGSASPSVVFTGSGAAAPYTFSYTVNGGAVQTVVSTVGSSATVSVPTNIAGDFVYALVGVKESSATACTNTASGSVTVSVRALPVGSISGTATVCQFDAAPTVVFTGSGAAAPYTFHYTINGGSLQTVTTVSGNSVAVPVPTNAAGSFQYALVDVQESGTGTCSNIATGSATVTVNPQPVKAVLASPNTHLCNGETGQITVVNWVSGSTYTWYKDGVYFATSSTNKMDVTQAGSYTVMVTTDKGCNASVVSDPLVITVGAVTTPIITGWLHVCPGGKASVGVIPIEGDIGYDLWKWSEPPDKRVLSGDSIFSAYAGQYQVWVSRDGCADSLRFTVSNDDTGFPAGRLVLSRDTIGYGEAVVLTAMVSGAVQYEWDVGDGHWIKTDDSILVQNFFKSSSVSVRAISERNCVSVFEGSVIVGEMAPVLLPRAPVIGNLKDWNVFPIPFSNKLKVSVILKRSETVRLDLFTMEGRWVKSWERSGTKGENLFSLDGLDGLSSGLFYLITAYYNGEKHFDKVFKY